MLFSSSPIRELISTFSELYIDTGDEYERIEVPDDISFPPPIPLEMEKRPEVSSFSAVVERLGQLEERLTSVEKRLDECNRKVDEGVTQAEVNNRCQKLEDRLTYRMERECSRIQQKLELSIQDLGRSMVD